MKHKRSIWVVIFNIVVTIVLTGALAFVFFGLTSGGTTDLRGFDVLDLEGNLIDNRDYRLTQVADLNFTVVPKLADTIDYSVKIIANSNAQTVLITSNLDDRYFLSKFNNYTDLFGINCDGNNITITQKQSLPTFLAHVLGVYSVTLDNYYPGVINYFTLVISVGQIEIKANLFLFRVVDDFEINDSIIL